jgi:hypothetical protein
MRWFCIRGLWARQVLGDRTCHACLTCTIVDAGSHIRSLRNITLQSYNVKKVPWKVTSLMMSTMAHINIIQQFSNTTHKLQRYNLSSHWKLQALLSQVTYKPKFDIIHVHVSTQFILKVWAHIYFITYLFIFIYFLLVHVSTTYHVDS